MPIMAFALLHVTVYTNQILNVKYFEINSFYFYLKIVFVII